MRPKGAPSHFSFPRASCPRPYGPPSAYGLAPARLVRAQREVTKRKGTRGSCSAHSVSAVPCVARNPAAGASERELGAAAQQPSAAIHGLGHARLAPAADSVARHEQRELRAELFGEFTGRVPRTCMLEAGLRPGWPLRGAPAGRRAAGGKARRDARTMRACFSPVHGCAVEKPRKPDAYSEGRKPGERLAGVAFSLVTFSWPLKRK